MNISCWLSRLLFGLCFLVAFSNTAHADYYRWSGYGSNYFDNPQSACEDRLAHLSWVANADSASATFVMVTPPASGQCKFNRNGSYYQSVSMTAKLFTGCPADQVEDPVTKECNPPEPPPPDCSTAGLGIFSKTGPIINSNGSIYVVTQGGGSVCYGQCSHTLNSSPASCYSSGEGSSSGFCNYIGTPTGETCSEPDAPLGSTGAPLNPADTPNVPPSDPNDPGCPDGYGWSGTTCAKNPPPDGGDTGGGDTGGGDTGGGDTGGGDTGGGSGGGGDTGGGDTGGGDTGGGDTGTGDGSGAGDGTGAGGGSGDGDGTDTEEPPQSSVGGEACTAQVTCEGDAIQCAILRQQKAQKCFAEEDRDYSKAKPIIDSAIAGPEYQLKEATVDVASGFSTGTRFLPAGCPAPKSMYISTIGRTITLSWQPLCDYASMISYIVVAMASLFFIVYVGRSFGGE